MVSLCGAGRFLTTGFGGDEVGNLPIPHKNPPTVTAITEYKSCPDQLSISQSSSVPLGIFLIGFATDVPEWIEGEPPDMRSFT